MAGTLTAPENVSNPTAPASGYRVLYAKADGWYDEDSAGNIYHVAGEQITRVSTQFDATTNTTLANVTSLTANVSAGKAYRFIARLFVDADATGGHKYAIAGTATATAIKYQVDSIDNTAKAFKITSRLSALAGSVGEASATTYYTTISGVITVNAAGTLTVQFAQNASSGTSSVLTLSSFEVRQIA
jgi:hypothetical protein